MTIQNFYLEHLTTNYLGLEELFKNSEAISEIENFSKDKQVLKYARIDTSYFNRWSIFWITITQPIHLLFASLYLVISNFFYIFNLPTISRIFEVLSKQAMRDWEEISHQWDFEKNPLLVPSFNVHQIFTWDVYGLEDISFNSIRDEMIPPLTYQNSAMERGAKQALKVFHQTVSFQSKPKAWIHWILRKTLPNLEKIHSNEFISIYKKEGLDPAMKFFEKKYRLEPFHPSLQSLYSEMRALEEDLHKFRNISLYSEKGMCRGASLWFIYLYFRTKNLFEDPTKHLIGIANQFISGMPRQAAVLQALDDTHDLLQLKKTELKEHKISIYELDKNSTTASSKIASLPEGIYRVGCYLHSFVYIKVDQQKQFVWNPESGLMPMKGDEMLQMILKHHYKAGNPRSEIYFHRYESLFEEESL